MTNTQIVLFKSHERIAQKLIRWQTDSQYSHAGLLFSQKVLVESRIPDGVQWNLFKYDPLIHDVFDVHTLVRVSEKVYEFVCAQAGKGYDYWGCLRFISRRRLPENDKWFCSELVFEAFAQAGVHLLNNVESYQVSPGDLATSPYLYKVSF